MSRRVRYLDEPGSQGMHIDFYDPEAERHPLPAYPKGFMTRRQLRASGLRPGGQPPVVQILWKAPQRPRPHPVARGLPLRHRPGKTKPRSNTGCPHLDRKQAE